MAKSKPHTPSAKSAASNTLKGAEVFFLVDTLNKLESQENIPFNLKFTAGRILNAWTPSYQFIDKHKNQLIQKYGELSPDGQQIQITPASPHYVDYQKDIQTVFSEGYTASANYNNLTEAQVGMIPNPTIKIILGLSPVMDDGFFAPKNATTLSLTYERVSDIKAGLDSISNSVIDNLEVLQKLAALYKEVSRVDTEVIKILTEFYHEIGEPVEGQPDKLQIADELKEKAETRQNEIISKDLYEMTIPTIFESDLEAVSSIGIRAIAVLHSVIA